MDELAKAIQKKYIEDLTAKYPLHRFVVLFIIIVSCYIYLNGSGLLAGIRNMKVSFIFDFKSGLISNITMLQIVICLIITRIISMLYEKLSKISFHYISKMNCIKQYTENLEKNFNEIKSENEILNYYVSKDISKELEKKRVKLKCKNINGEYALAFIFSFLYGFIELNFFEWMIIVSLAFFILYILYSSVKFYIEEFMPYYVAERVLLGSDVKFGSQ